MAYRKSETRELGRLQVGPWDPGPGTPKISRMDLGLRTTKVESGTRDLKIFNGTRDPGPQSGTWDPGPQSI